MHGPGHAPPPRRDTSASVIVLRVLFATVPLFSCGMLSWATMLRLALVTRQPRDWVLFGVNLVAVAACFGTIMTDPTEELRLMRSNVAIIVMLAVAVLVTGYYLFAEIRHFATAAQPAHHAFAQTQFGYGHPSGAGTVAPYHQGPPVPPQYPATGPAAPAFPAPPQAEPQLRQQPTPPPGTGQAPVTPRPQRIAQVRAELDELSDLLRKDDGT